MAVWLVVLGLGVACSSLNKSVVGNLSIKSPYSFPLIGGGEENGVGKLHKWR
jgi:hypothetical protein